MDEKKRGNDQLKRIPELLAPAGNLEKLKIAIHYGADAVYLGGKQLSLRAKAGNFTVDELAEGVAYAHDKGAKVYTTVNVFAHNCDLEGLENYLLSLRDCQVDGIIISDPGILDTARNVIEDIPIHLSTQANVTNHRSAKFWFEQGVDRINLARELSLEEIGRIRSQVRGEIEVFIHGALCISYSGRCMLSNYLTDRDANKGSCSHPCRFSYRLMEEKRPGEYFPVEEDGRGTYIFNSKDLCMLRLLPELLGAGVDTLKIEGRMKSIFYVGGVVRVYRAALDYLSSLPEQQWREPSSITLPEVFSLELLKTGTRGITENFAQGKPTHKDMLYHSSRASQNVEPVAVIRNGSDPPLVEIRNKVHVGEEVELMGKEMAVEPVIIEAIMSESGESMVSANPGNTVKIVTVPRIKNHRVYDMIRRELRAKG